MGQSLLISRRAFLAAIGASGLISSVDAATTEQIVIFHRTGLAIAGFDPVAYFVDGAAELGQHEFEYPFGGAVWRFRNEGNQAAFVADPKVYMPRFGGYDPVGIARGVAVAGDPRVWLIVDERLYLFYSAEARTAFADNFKTIVEAAARNWPAVQATLSP